MTTATDRNIILIAHNLRSCHNVGSLLRTAEGLGCVEVVLSGYTPYPAKNGDTRMAHEALKISKQINKTALGAEEMVSWRHEPEVSVLLDMLHHDGWHCAAIEQSADSISLPEYVVPPNIALMVGREVEGLEPEILARMDNILEIPMFGRKESFNVVQAAAMALYHCRFQPFLCS